MAHLAHTLTDTQVQIDEFSHSGTSLQSEKTWLYVRIYCPSAMSDDVIMELVHPAVSELRAHHLIEQFFFIRYNEGGNHIRLRVYGKRHVVLGPVRLYLNRQIEQFFAAHGQVVHGPSDNGPDGMDDPCWQPWQPYEIRRPMHSFEYDRYLPELSRYGGTYGLRTSERHFEQSSDTVLRVLAHERAGHGSRHNAALLLMEASLDAFGLSDAEKIEALARQTCYWLRSQWLTIDHVHWFAREYERLRRQLSALLPIGISPAAQCRSRITWGPVVQQWREEVQEIHRELVDLEYQGLLTTSRPALLLFYIHMLCNRLGITPPNEACLAYLMHRHYAEQLDLPAMDFFNSPPAKLDRLIAPMVDSAREDRETMKRLAQLAKMQTATR
jgi:thiopeptide-type bacteriocin biosynthesis protein